MTFTFALDPLALLAVLALCATALGCTWLVADRWYAHRDRAVQRLVAHTHAAVTDATHETARIATRAALRLNEHVDADRAERDRLAADVKRLLDLEQERQRTAAFGRRA